MKDMINCACKKIVTVVLLCSIGYGAMACSDNDPQKETQADDPAMYANPVVPRSLPDPTLVRASDGWFYLYATEDIRHTPIYRSADLVEWEFRGTAFTSETRPDFEPRGGLWAPDINYINGKYVLYYSMSVWGGEWTCGIGVAVADSPEGPFTDQGKLFRSNEIDVQNSIDPFFITEDGRNYLFWGSFRGIYVIELSADGLSILPGAEKKQIAGTAYEGTYILKKDGFYYLFASIGSCCEGVNSTYTTVVGRSDNLMGPYRNKVGQEMMNNRHEVLVKGSDRFVGTGHNSEIVTDDEGKDWMLYHAVDKLNPKGRVLMLDEVQWNQGWPSVSNGTPSMEWKRPVFGK
jgi:arabinan endo-1,5-alpha-L-arabinosidase